jgi:hypothetical protein
MARRLSVIAILCLLALATTVEAKRQILSLPVTRRAKNGISHSFKYKTLIAAGANSSIGSSLIGCQFTDFTISVDIGSQTFHLILDTGSSTLAVAGAGCRTCAPASPMYTNTGSLLNDPQVNGMYADASGWTGRVYSDVVGISDVADGVRMNFASMTTSNNFFSSNTCNDLNFAVSNNGIIGFAYPSLALQNTQSWFFQWAQANPSMPKVFALQLCLTGGTLWLGGWPERAAGTTILYTPIVSKNFYHVALNDIRLDSASESVSIGVPSTVFQKAVVDSGTSALVLPQTAYNALVARISKSTGFLSVFPSNFFTQGLCYGVDAALTTDILNQMLPSMTLVIGEISITLPAINSYLSEFDDLANGVTYYCSGIQAIADSYGLTVLGWPFMTNVVTIFDVEHRRIGFAVQNTCARSTGAFYIQAAAPTNLRTSEMDAAPHKEASSSSDHGEVRPPHSDVSSSTAMHTQGGGGRNGRHRRHSSSTGNNIASSSSSSTGSRSSSSSSSGGGSRSTGAISVPSDSTFKVSRPSAYLFMATAMLLICLL